MGKKGSELVSDILQDVANNNLGVSLQKRDELKASGNFIKRFFCGLFEHGDYSFAKRVEGSLTAQVCTHCGSTWHSLY